MDGWIDGERRVLPPSLGIHSAIDKGSMSAKMLTAAVNYKLTCLPSHRPIESTDRIFTKRLKERRRCRRRRRLTKPFHLNGAAVKNQRERLTG